MLQGSSKLLFIPNSFYLHKYLFIFLIFAVLLVVSIAMVFVYSEDYCSLSCGTKSNVGCNPIKVILFDLLQICELSLNIYIAFC